MPSAKDYRYFVPITTRWHDNDVFGHVNNVIYYSFFDTAVNQFLLKETDLDIHNGAEIAFVVSTSCEYHASISYPESIEVGIHVSRLGSSSVTYGLAVFSQDRKKLAAHGSFVHVYVDRKNQRPIPIPEKTRSELNKLIV